MLSFPFHVLGVNNGSMSRPLPRPHQSSCPLTPGHDLPTHSRHHDLRTGLTMSASTSSFKHASSYGFAHREQSSSNSSYSPLRRLQHLTSMVSQPDLVLPMREPVRAWDWGMNKKDRGQETDSWTDCTASSGSYPSSQATSREETLDKSAGQKQLLAQLREKEAPSGGNPDKKSSVCFSGPPSPAFSLDSNSPFANGFLHFESSLFEDDDNDEDQETKSTEGSSQVKEERPAGAAATSAVNSDCNVAPSSAKVVTRSQSSGQRRRYWDGSDDEWDSDTELFLFGDTYSVHSMASFTSKQLHLSDVKTLATNKLAFVFNVPEKRNSLLQLPGTERFDDKV